MKIPKQANHLTHPFQPIFNAATRILILGSFPSKTSRADDFYYMHPQNRFWRVLSSVIDPSFNNRDKHLRTELLLKHGIGLYDVVLECDIINSDDATIKNIKPCDLKAIVSRIENLERIILDGNKAYVLFCKFFPEYIEKAVKVPSTSPANASIKIDELIKIWSQALIKKPSD